VARYCYHPSSDISHQFSSDAEDLFNPNGSINRIAGVTNEQGNVVGLMPHPERAADPLVNGEDGLCILRSGLTAVSASV
jgi:phosphoribosylformylglycinamidine synthase